MTSVVVRAEDDEVETEVRGGTSAAVRRRENRLRQHSGGSISPVTTTRVVAESVKSAAHGIRGVVSLMQ